MHTNLGTLTTDFIIRRGAIHKEFKHDTVLQLTAMLNSQDDQSKLQAEKIITMLLVYKAKVLQKNHDYACRREERIDLIQTINTIIGAKQHGLNEDSFGYKCVELVTNTSWFYQPSLPNTFKNFLKQEYLSNTIANVLSNKDQLLTTHDILIIKTLLDKNEINYDLRTSAVNLKPRMSKSLSRTSEQVKSQQLHKQAKLSLNSYEQIEKSHFSQQRPAELSSLSKYHQIMEDLTSAMNTQSTHSGQIGVEPMFMAIIHYLNIHEIIPPHDTNQIFSDPYSLAKAYLIEYNHQQVIFGMATSKAENESLLKFIENYKLTHSTLKPLIITLAGALVGEQEHMLALEKGLRVNHLLLMVQMPGADSYYVLDPKSKLGRLHGPHPLPQRNNKESRIYPLRNKIQPEVIALNQQGITSTNCVRICGTDALLLILQHLFNNQSTANIHALIEQGISNVFLRNQTFWQKTVNLVAESAQAQNLGNYLLKKMDEDNNLDELTSLESID